MGGGGAAVNDPVWPSVVKFADAVIVGNFGILAAVVLVVRWLG